MVVNLFWVVVSGGGFILGVETTCLSFYQACFKIYVSAEPIRK